MPLHAVPLCDFEYVRDNTQNVFNYKGYLTPLGNFKYTSDVSSAVFEYDTTENLSKYQGTKLFYNENRKEIYKSNSKMFKIYIKNMAKIHGRELFDNKYKTVTKHLNKELESLNKKISKNIDKILEQNNILIEEIKGINLDGTRIKAINIEKSFELNEAENRLINIKKYFELGRAEIKLINIEKSFELSNAELKLINIKIYKEIAYSKLREFDKSISPFYMNRLNVSFLNKFQNIFLDRSVLKNIDKILLQKPLEVNERNMYEANKIALDRVCLKFMDINTYRFYEKVALRNIDKFRGMSPVYKNNLKDFTKSNENYLYRVALKCIDNSLRSQLMHRGFFNNIYKSYEKYTDRIGIKTAFKHSKILLRRNAQKRLLKGNKIDNMLKEKIINMSKSSEIDMFKEKIIKAYKSREFSIFRETKVKIFKIGGIFVNNTSQCIIDKKIEKELMLLRMFNIDKSYEKYVSSSVGKLDKKEHKYIERQSANKDIYVENSSKYIDVVRRWWWLNSLEPKDSIIIPDVDYEYSGDQLYNHDYEYLRFIDHPIPWGSDYGLHEYPISIEIMLDLVNILLELWHDNVQAWLCVTGKESIQFIMEILYDWYNLESSKPNKDYYRAYRWIRWEAEKVYFLDLDNGLQAVGVLIANLIDYLKQHHFNIVPIWRNPKAMSIERNFNRMAQNDDLIKALDKNKGKRHYYIKE
ncbi:MULTISPECIES: hypothetical protein [Clostridium]|uniref:hypothetical protein n=1 Tax=Clostridium TaxID=1485 RepID=UPI000826499C|nr:MULTISPECIES: hypothetical protein [Clostridium]PJI07033.1 hypothetical protein CUB90_03770 [Clostridium sp. CT7]